MSRASGRAYGVIVLVLVGSSVLGGLVGSRAQDEGQSAADLKLRDFARTIALVEDNYAGKVDSEDLVEDAIQGMLRTLDPHSNFLDRETYSEMKDEQRGRFYGLGIQITKRGPDKPLTIIAPIDGTPASRAGLHAGDIIYKIEGEETMDLTVQQAVRRLKGDKGTKVTITIQRPGDDKPFDVTLIRDEIPTRSVPVAFVMQPSVGFVRISNFTATTAKELDAALKRLRDQGATRLLLDLRGNPGGLLDQAVQVAERFLAPGKLVVYTRGRIAGSDQDYVAQKGVERIDLPLVVLVDHSSASASEIVSGAIQDHDRGLVVGESTFGKGLVQRVIPLADGVTAVAVTTAKYYTPSGRLIQRDYSDLDDYFLDPEASPQEDASLASPREVHHTDSGRVVYGGGGITPDHIEKAKRASGFLSRLVRENLVFDFVIRYLAAHPDIEGELVVSDGVFEEFRKFLESRKVPFTDEDLKNNRDDLSLRLRAQVAKVRHGAEAESRVLLEGDVQVQKALTLFDEAARLHRNGEVGRRHGPEAGSIASDPSL